MTYINRLYTSYHHCAGKEQGVGEVTMRRGEPNLTSLREGKRERHHFQKLEVILLLYILYILLYILYIYYISETMSSHCFLQFQFHSMYFFSSFHILIPSC